MFIHVATLYSVQPEAAEAFVGSIRAGAYSQRVARRVTPDFVASDLLEHQSSPSPVFLCIDFWVSRERYLRARHSSVYEPLFQLGHDMAAATIELGVFAFPTLAEDIVVPQTADLCSKARQPWSAMKTPSTIQAALYLDLELNCSDRFRPGDPDPEIIEIGIVELDIHSLRIVCEREYLARPHRDIGRRCTKITGLTNEDFKGAAPSREVIAGICAEWPGRPTSIAWGEDGATLTRACRQESVRMPFRRFIDLSQIVRQALLFENQLSLRATLELLGLAFDGCTHMALADARNTARLHAEIMRRLQGADPASGREVTNPSQPTWFGQLLANSLKTIPPACALPIRASTKEPGLLRSGKTLNSDHR